MKASIALLGIAAVVLAACAQPSGAARAHVSRDGERPPARQLPPYDGRTPDTALKWLWILHDSIDSEVRKLRSDPRSPINQIKGTLAQGYTGAARADALDELPPPDIFAREILEVDKQSETRAVVLARIINITPIPPGATVDEARSRLRREGELYRYIFERDSAGWKLAQIETDYGTGWHAWYGGPPSVPTSTRP